MKKTNFKDISVTEYAKLRGISRTAVNTAILCKYKMKGVKSVSKIGNMNILKVDVSVFDET